MVLVLLSALRKIRPKPSPCCPTAVAPCGTLVEQKKKKKKKKGVLHAVDSKVESYISEKKLCLLGDVVPLQWQQMEVKLSLLRHDLP